MNKDDALEWIAKHRIPASGDLDIVATAKALGISLRIRDINKLQGLYMPGIIALDSNLEPDQKLFVFGHELGHHFCISKGYDRPKFRNPVEETFCDWFAEQLTGIPTTTMRGEAHV